MPGISGTKGRDQRPGCDRLCRGFARREFDQVAAWSVDRLGRSLQDLVGFLGELHAKGVDLYLHQQGIDTGTPAGKAMFQMMASDIGSSQEWQPSSVLGTESDCINQLPGSVRGDTGQPSDFSTKSGFRGHESLLRTERPGFTELSIGNRRLDRILNNGPVVSGRNSEQVERRRTKVKGGH